MAGCIDKRFQDKLYAYELGMLDDAERRDLELHILDCESCLEEVKQFQGTIGFIKDDTDVRATVAALDDDHSAEEILTPRNRRQWNTLVPISLVAAIVLIVLLAKDWQLVFQPSLPAVAAENRLAVMPFDNITHPDDTSHLGNVISNLVITDLAQSQYVQVVSSRRLLDLRRLILREADSSAIDNMDFALAQRAGARWMLWGTVTESDSALILTAELVELATGTISGSHKIAGESGVDVFSLADRLTILVKADLTLPIEALQEPDPKVADVTTNSPLAYRYYLDGIEYMAGHYRTEAVRSFDEAIELDSTFAMAYYHLAALKDPQLIHEAVKYSDKAGRREQLYIQSRLAAVLKDIPEAISILKTIVEQYPDDKEAYYLLAYRSFHRYEILETIALLERAIEIDPFYRSAYELLVHAYDEAGEFESALTAINAYIGLVPNEAAPYGTRGYLYATHGKIEEAIASYDKVLTLRPGYDHAVEQLGNLNLFRGDYRQADSLYQQLLESESRAYRGRARYYRALIPVHQGKLEEALAAFDVAIVGDSADRTYTQMSVNYFQESRIYSERQQYGLALEALDHSMSALAAVHPEDSGQVSQFNLLLLTEAGQTARAQKALEALQAAMGDSERNRCAYWFGLGAMQMLRGEPDSAAISLEKAAKLTIDFPTHFMLARAYQQAGRLSEAVRTYESQLEAYSEWRLCWSIWSTKMHYYLGVAYEESNWHAQAAEQYELFLERWREADPDIPEIDDARRRLEALGSS